MPEKKFLKKRIFIFLNQFLQFFKENINFENLLKKGFLQVFFIVFNMSVKLFLSIDLDLNRF